MHWSKAMLAVAEAEEQAALLKRTEADAVERDAREKGEQAEQFYQVCKDVTKALRQLAGWVASEEVQS